MILNTLLKFLIDVGVPLPESVDSMKVEKVADEKLSTWSYSEINQHNQNSNLESTVQEMLWPTKMYSTARSYSPPKPDTPPSNVSKFLFVCFNIK